LKKQPNEAKKREQIDDELTSTMRLPMHAATTLVILLLFLVSALSFIPSPQPAHSISSALRRYALTRASSFEQSVRNSLDEAVVLYQHCSLQESSTDEAESIARDIGRILYAATSSSTSRSTGKNHDQLSQQFDQAILCAAQDPTMVPRVEALAISYWELTRNLPSMNHKPTVFDSLVLSESTLRLQKLRLCLSEDGTSSAFPLDVTERVSPKERSLEAPYRMTADFAAALVDTQLGSNYIRSTSQQIDGETSPDDGVASATKEHERPVDDIQPTAQFAQDKNERGNTDISGDVDFVDVAIVGAGIAGLCAGAILNTIYGKKVGIYESHYLPGGCAHAFDRVASNNVTFTFDSGPTIVLGCSKEPYNPLRQVLDAIGQSVDWIPYDGWGMIENPGRDNELRWKVQLGENSFQEGPIKQFGTDATLVEFEELRELTKGLVRGAVGIPAMAMRAGKYALVPLLRYLPALFDIVKQGEEFTRGTFKPYMDGPIFTVTDPWLRSWLDALAFSLSGLPASRTAAAAMAYVLYDMHRPNAALDYPRGGLGQVIDSLVRGVEQGDRESKVNLRSHVVSIDTSLNGERITGLTLRGGKTVKAKLGVISTVPMWSLTKLIQNRKALEVLDDFIQCNKDRSPKLSWEMDEGIGFIRGERESVDGAKGSLLYRCDTAEMTGSFLHLHLAIRSDGLNLDRLEAHYTVMDRSLAGDGSERDGPCGELNMIAVSNPCAIDRSLAPDGFIVLHAYGAANEPFEIWKDVKRGSREYEELKQRRSEVLWRAVESIIPDVRERVVLDMVGSPLTHARFLRRPMGTYGAATEDYLQDGSTPYETLVLAGEGVFPGIGVPAVALSGASAANSMVSPLLQWKALDKLRTEAVLRLKRSATK
jgi:phytoene dehydrogenase-like protein